MARRMAWIAAGVAGLLAVGAATAASATAGEPAAALHWRIVKSVKTDSSGQFTAVVATGKTTGWAFDGFGPAGGPAAWERSGSTWKKVAFPGKSDEFVAAAAATSPADVWAFTDNIFGTGSRVVRWTGSTWSVVKTFPGGIYGASVLGSSDVWVFGLLPEPGSPAIGVWHYNGATWSRIGKNIEGGSALSDHDVWGFSGTSVEHWNGSAWESTSVRSLLPAKLTSGLNDPQVVGILALSDSDVFAVGNGNAEDDGGPVVVLHYNGSKWTKVAQGLFGAGPAQEISSDGSGGLWLAMFGPFAGGASYLLHYTDGKLLEANLPVSAPKITIDSVARVPGTTQQLAGGFTHGSDNRGTDVVAVLLQYS